MRVDEAAKRGLDWDMLEDRRKEVEEEQTPSCSRPFGDPRASSSFPSGVEAFCAPPLRVSDQRPGPSADSGPCSASLALSVLPAPRLAHVWKALLGEFRVRPARPPPDWEQTAFTLRRTGGQLCLSYSTEEQPWSSGGDSCPSEAGLSGISLEELDWLQRRRAVQLLHQADAPAFKVDPSLPGSVMTQRFSRICERILFSEVASR